MGPEQFMRPKTLQLYDGGGGSGAAGGD